MSSMTFFHVLKTKTLVTMVPSTFGGGGREVNMKDYIKNHYCLLINIVKKCSGHWKCSLKPLGRCSFQFSTHSPSLWTNWCFTDKLVLYYYRWSRKHRMESISTVQILYSTLLLWEEVTITNGMIVHRAVDLVLLLLTLHCLAIQPSTTPIVISGAGLAALVFAHRFLHLNKTRSIAIYIQKAWVSSEHHWEISYYQIKYIILFTFYLFFTT
jgi:hypothetical protein